MYVNAEHIVPRLHYSIVFTFVNRFPSARCPLGVRIPPLGRGFESLLTKQKGHLTMSLLACLEGFYPLAVSGVSPPMRLAFRPLHIPTPSFLPPQAALGFGSPSPRSGLRILTHKTKRTSDDVLTGVLGGIRTPDPLVRSQILYPTELQAHLIQMH